jgi:translation initiation factor 2 alpha subunit (eIF-2alpha)
VVVPDKDGKGPIDDVKETVNLSYRRVKECERDNYIKKFDYFSRIYRLTNEIKDLCDLPMRDVLEMTMWKTLEKDDLDNSKDIYHSILENPMSYLTHIPEKNRKKIAENIESRITRTSMAVHQEFDFIVLCNDAVNTIKEILDFYDNDFVIEYVSAPKYRIVVEGRKTKECDEKIQKCIDILKTKINNRKIIFEIGNKKIVKECEMTLKFLQQ